MGKDKKNIKIGFIGQGFIGKNYADDFESRGFYVVRYALEEPYNKNKDKIVDCEIVFIAVPTPTTTKGFDDSILREAIKAAGDGATVVIKSTLAVGITEEIQKENPGLFVMHSPEFLTEATASRDAANPGRNIVGIPIDNDEYKRRAEEVISVLPKAPYESVCHSKEAELIKHGGNNWFYFKVVFINMLHDLADAHNLNWKTIRDGMAADVRIGSTHLDPKHKSGGKAGGEGRGAGGHCFIKDFESFIEMYKEHVGDDCGNAALEAVRNKNLDLMLKTKKDLDLLEGVYGDLSKRNIK